MEELNFFHPKVLGSCYILSYLECTRGGIYGGHPGSKFMILESSISKAHHCKSMASVNLNRVCEGITFLQI